MFSTLKQFKKLSTKVVVWTSFTYITKLFNSSSKLFTEVDQR